MFQQSVYKAVSIAYAGTGTNLVGTRNRVGAISPTFCIGGPAINSWSELDFPRAYAARVRRPKYPIIGNNSEQIAFPQLINLSQKVWITALASAQITPLGQWFNQKQRPRPLTLTISGLTENSSSVPLSGCTVKLYITSSDLEIASTISDANGKYSFSFPAASPTATYYLVAYLAGSPDVAGTTVNTVVAT